MVLWRKRLKDRKMQDLTNDRVELHELQFDAFLERVFACVAWLFI